ncbi:MAG: hypothetical protein AAF281_05120 [Pseudomonadota bacterium]
MAKPVPDAAIALLKPTVGRRIAGAFFQGALGVLILGLGTTVAGLGPQIALIAVGGVMLWQTLILFRATEVGIVLTETGLYEETGREIAAFEAIGKVDRSFFAIKPSNGFLIVLKEPAPRGWRPGVWWRIGRRVGIGGTTNGRAARELADILAFKLEEQRAPPGDAG